MGCSSTDDLKIVRPEIALIQLYAPVDLGHARGGGTMFAHFGVRIANRSAEPITLRRIDLQSIGGGGYYLRREDRSFDETIPPGSVGAVEMQAQAYFLATPSGTPSHEPVTIRAICFFDSPVGSFRQIVVRNISQFSAGPR